MPLDVEKALTILSAQGPLAQELPFFEPRPEQQHMMHDVISAFNQDEIALIEAGTGTGKSLAYLIPALLWAAQMKECTVISTNTIQLQEQLLRKDIPLALKALKLDLKVVLAKGMNNYICLKRLQEETAQCNMLEKDRLLRMNEWAESTREGTRASIPFPVPGEVWDNVGAEADLCSGRQCPHQKECFFFRARQQLKDAHVIIVNHHLLFADLSIKAEKGDFEEAAILPPFKRLIIDEAHNIEDIATEYFGMRLSRLGLLRQVGRLCSTQQENKGKLPALREQIAQSIRGDADAEHQNLLNRLQIDLPGLKESVAIFIRQSFDSIVEFTDNLAKVSESAEKKVRIREEHTELNLWKFKVNPLIKQLIEELERLSTALYSLNKDVEKMDRDDLNKTTQSTRTELLAFASRLYESAKGIKSFFYDEPSPQKVRWMEAKALKNGVNGYIVAADIDVSQALYKHLFSIVPTIVLCSATLTTNRDFSFFRQRLGLVPDVIQDLVVKESIYDSPFNYPEQALLTVVTDMPHPHHPNFLQAASENIVKALMASHGNAFVLFTSYKMMQDCYRLILPSLMDNKFHVFIQGEGNKNDLLHKFTQSPKAVLFGTDTFWEGIDVSGENLRCVILVKIPFRVPSEPIIEARTEHLQTQGKNPFYDYTVPNAIVKFKQGFGRLIRHKRDRGCIVCLDARINAKAYGQLFLNSLPPSKRLFVQGSELYAVMRDFYKKTYHLIKK